MAKSYGTLRKKRDYSKEANFELQCKETTFLYFGMNSLEFLTVYSQWLSGDSSFAKYLDR